MRDCSNAEIRDRLPELVHSRLAAHEHAAVESHVAECPDCAAETALIRLIAGGAAAGVPKMDTSRITAALPFQSRRVPGWRPQFSGATVRWAAGITLAVLGLGALRITSRSERQNVASRSLPETSAERAVSRPLGGAFGGYSAAPARGGLVLVGGIDALTLDQLEALVTGVETLSALPAVEPEPVPLSGGDEIR